MLSEGARLPSFRCVDHHGRPVSSDDFAGRWTVLWWYVKADTPG